MNWDLVGEDTYYRGRAIEARAREKGTAEAWQEYADLKAGKGSYLLAVHGYMNAALFCERQGHTARTLDLFQRAFQNAQKAGSKELLLMVAYRYAMLAEQVGQWGVCLDIYESLGRYCEEQGSFFLAADAYEHAAEVMVKAGMDVTSYAKPVQMWKRNAEYWRQRGQEEDACWSERHLDLYRKLIGGQPA